MGPVIPEESRAAAKSADDVDVDFVANAAARGDAGS